MRAPTLVAPRLSSSCLEGLETSRAVTRRRASREEARGAVGIGAGMGRMRGRRLVDWREIAIALALLGAILVVVSVVLPTCANAGECLNQRQALAQAQVKGYARRGVNNCW